MAIKVTLGYQGGEQETIVIRPLGLVAAERHFKGETRGRSIESTLYAAWFLKGRPGDFDDWLGTLEEVLENQEETVPLDQEPSPDS